MKITAEYFEKRTGFKPIQDDLERSNCKEAGEIGHQSCGWMHCCDRPNFMVHEENCIGV